MKKQKTISLLKTPKSIELEYYRELKKLANQLKKDVNEMILPILENVSLDSKYTKDVGVNDLLSALNLLQGKYSNIFAFTTRVASNIISRILNLGNDKFRKSLEQTYGVDVGRMINQNKLNDLVALQRHKQEVLIKSIPAQFFSQIELIIQNGISGNKTYKEIAKEIKGISGISSTYGKLDNRVKLIARNEVSTINANLNNARAESSGITQAIWQTSGDERVRGVNPKDRQDHASLDGQVYDLKVGLKDPRSGEMITPGSAINCRCQAIYIIPKD